MIRHLILEDYNKRYIDLLGQLTEVGNRRTKIEYIWNGELLGDFPSWALKTAWKEQGNEVLSWLIDYMDNK